jgi:hypothetical protein
MCYCDRFEAFEVSIGWLVLVTFVTMYLARSRLRAVPYLSPARHRHLSFAVQSFLVWYLVLAKILLVMQTAADESLRGAVRLGAYFWYRTVPVSSRGIPMVRKMSNTHTFVI